MIKDEAETIRELANQLMEEDVSVERRQRIARKIIEHARAGWTYFSALRRQ